MKIRHVVDVKLAVGTCILWVGILLDIVGIATSYWSTNETQAYGPRRRCHTNGPKTKYARTSCVYSDVDAWKSFTLLGVLLGVQTASNKNREVERKKMYK